MTLSREDAELFYELWFPLLDFVNRKLKVVPELKKISTRQKLDITEVKKIANVLWDDVNLIDEYIDNNAAHISDENKEVIRSWKRCITGRFILERHLKSGSVFIACGENGVFLVHGIISSWEDVLSDFKPPVLLTATLIPFRDKIISDGLVMPCNVCFGSGMRADFKDTYLSAKKSGTLRMSI